VNGNAYSFAFVVGCNHRGCLWYSCFGYTSHLHDVGGIMNCLEHFDVYYSETLELDLELRFTLTDYDPSVGVDYEFDYEALDEAGNDRADDLQQTERDEIERMIYKYIKDNIDKADYDPY
jgi:hypothetical protein